MSYLEFHVPTITFGRSMLSHVQKTWPCAKNRCEDWIQTEGTLLSLQLVKDEISGKHYLRGCSQVFTQEELETLINEAMEAVAQDLRKAVDIAVDTGEVEALQAENQRLVNGLELMKEQAKGLAENNRELYKTYTADGATSSAASCNGKMRAYLSTVVAIDTLLTPNK